MVAAPPPVVPLHTSAAPAQPSAPTAAPMRTVAPPPPPAFIPASPPTSPPTQGPQLQGPTPSQQPVIPLVAAPPSPPVHAAAPVPTSAAYSPPETAPVAAGTDSGRGLSRVLFGVFSAVLAIGLLATGFLFARAIDDEPTSAGSTAIVAGGADDPVIAPVISSGDEPVAAVAQSVLPSVVNILAGEGQGSGIAYSGNHIVTNAHVVEGSTDVVVQLADGSSIDGEVVGRDEDRDLAVVRIVESFELTPATFAPSESVEVGQLAIALGSPFGLDQTVTSGVVSAIDRVVPAGVSGQNLVAMLQTDAPINPGNSGGALADREGRIIGMNTAIRTETGQFAGVGFAIPSDTIRLIADRLIAGESIELGFLGVSMDQAPIGTTGALVVEVVAGSPAADAGLEVGDVVVGIESITVSEPADLAAAIRLRSPGDEVDITVTRDGETFTFTATLSAG